MGISPLSMCWTPLCAQINKRSIERASLTRQEYGEDPTTRWRAFRQGHNTSKRMTRTWCSANDKRWRAAPRRTHCCRMLLSLRSSFRQYIRYILLYLIKAYAISNPVNKGWSERRTHLEFPPPGTSRNLGIRSEPHQPSSVHGGNGIHTRAHASVKGQRMAAWSTRQIYNATDIARSTRFVSNIRSDIPEESRR